MVDEIQNVVNNKNGKSLVGMLTQLINNSGISICMVGTPESAEFFEQAMQLARRSLGLRYDLLEYGNEFKAICETLYFYQYVRNYTNLTDSVIEWLYEHSGGNISVVVSLIHDAQEIAILNGIEVLNFDSLNEAYAKRLALLHGYINVSKKSQTLKPKKKNSAVNLQASNELHDDTLIYDLVSDIKSDGTDVVQTLKEHIIIVEVCL